MVRSRNSQIATFVEHHMLLRDAGEVPSICNNSPLDVALVNIGGG